MKLGSVLRIAALSALVAIFPAAPAWAADLSAKPESPADQAAAMRAKKLLQRAVGLYKEKGDAALDSFSRAGEFIDGEHYVYVVSTKGTLLASGGPSSSLVGRDIGKLTDTTGKLLFREFMASTEAGGAGQVEYRWQNPASGKVERKIAYLQREGDKIIAVGFYLSRASPEAARKLLDEAAQAVVANPGKAFAIFNDQNGKFVQDDLYVFAVGLDDSRFRAHGAIPNLIGTDSKDLRDPKGKAIIVDMINIVRAKGEGQLEYAWKNPMTHRVETKHTFVRKVGDYLVGVGYYTR